MDTTKTQILSDIRRVALTMS